MFSGLVSVEDINDGVIQRGNLKQATVAFTVGFSRLSISRSCGRPAAAHAVHAHGRCQRTEHRDWSVGSLCREHDVGFRRSLFRETAEAYLAVDIPAERTAWRYRRRFRSSSHVRQRRIKGEFFLL